MYSTLYQLDSSIIRSEAEVETRFLQKLFADLGFPPEAIVPKEHIPALWLTDGRKRTKKEVDFLLKDPNGIARIVVEAKDPSKNIFDAWGQAASYALSINKDKPYDKRIKWLLISNGIMTALYPHDSNIPLLTLQLSDFASGMPPYVALRTHIKYAGMLPASKQALTFKPLPPADLNKLFMTCHNMVWKAEKLAPHDAFFEFCKFIFIKIREDKKRQTYGPEVEPYEMPLTLAWLKAQAKTSKHPVRDILLRELCEELEVKVQAKKKKRIFEKNETLELKATTCKTLIEKFESVDLSSIDEDLNGRMFEVFLNAAIRGKDLGQFFTPRSVVDFMTRISLRNIDLENIPIILDGCCGTAGFLIETMAYMTGRIRNDSRYNERDRIKKIEHICNDCLFGIEANKRTSRIARINMYLHGDGGSHIFHGDGLEESPKPTIDMTDEEQSETIDHAETVKNELFDIILSNPPFSMNYQRSKEEDKHIIDQFDFTIGQNSVKSSVLFLNRYEKLLKKGGEMLIVLDDTILNGKSYEDLRKWLLERFVLLGIHSLPFNTFLKAKANIKTSILHLRKKIDEDDSQGNIFMSISNNIGHDNSLKDTPTRNNLIEILIAYLEWQRTGNIETTIKDNADPQENLECPMQYWIVNPQDITTERFDAFFYCPELHNLYSNLQKRENKKEVEIKRGEDFNLVPKLTKQDKTKMIEEQNIYRYVEIGDVTTYGLITHYIMGTFDELPTRGEYQVKKGDILLALNNSSRGTVVRVPDEFDGMICTSGFLVIRPKNEEEGLLLWYCLRSDICKKQIYYLAQTASQPELKIESWNKYFRIPFPVNTERAKAIERTKKAFDYINNLSDINNEKFQ